MFVNSLVPVYLYMKKHNFNYYVYLQICTDFIFETSMFGYWTNWKDLYVWRTSWMGLIASVKFHISKNLQESLIN